jgi:hypothetical protein
MDVTTTTTWTPVALGSIVDGLLSGSLARLSPSLGRVSDAGALLYEGKVNSLFGESGCGKTWTALAIANQVLAVGGAVVFLDLEDDAPGVIGRLLDLGADPGSILARFAYIAPEGKLNDAAREALNDTLARLSPALVVIDSTGESIALEGLKPNDDDQVAVWFRKLPAAIAKQGPAVLVLDHVVKADAEALWPAGSQRKRAAVSGAAYAQVMVKPFSRDTAGLAKLVCAKDRHGSYRFRQKVAELHVSPAAGGVEVTLRQPQEPTGATSGQWRPTAIMEAVSKALEGSNEALTFNRVNIATRGKEQHIRTALGLLVAEGYVSTTDGPRRSTLHQSQRRYRQADDPLSDRFEPGDSQHPETAPSDCRLSPVPTKGTGRQSLNTGSPSPGDSGETVGRQSKCTVCDQPLHPVIAAEGGTTCPTCEADR